MKIKWKLIRFFTGRMNSKIVLKKVFLIFQPIFPHTVSYFFFLKCKKGHFIWGVGGVMQCNGWNVYEGRERERGRGGNRQRKPEEIYYPFYLYTFVVVATLIHIFFSPIWEIHSCLSFYAYSLVYVRRRHTTTTTKN